MFWLGYTTFQHISCFYTWMVLCYWFEIKALNWWSKCNKNTWYFVKFYVQKVWRFMSMYVFCNSVDLGLIKLTSSRGVTPIIVLISGHAPSFSSQSQILYLCRAQAKCRGVQFPGKAWFICSLKWLDSCNTSSKMRNSILFCKRATIHNYMFYKECKKGKKDSSYPFDSCCQTLTFAVD